MSMKLTVESIYIYYMPTAFYVLDVMGRYNILLGQD